MPDRLPIPTPDSLEGHLIDLRYRYARATRMVWTMLGVILLLVASSLLIGLNNFYLNKSVVRLTNQLVYQEQVRRRDRAEQRYALCQRKGELAPPKDLCVGYESLEAAYKTEGTTPPKER